MSWTSRRRLDKKFRHDIDVVVDRLVVREGMETRLADSLRTALDLADGIAMLETAPRKAIRSGSHSARNLPVRSVVSPSPRLNRGCFRSTRPLGPVRIL